MPVDSPHGSALPSKLFFRIGEVAGLVGVEPHVLRYWEREFRSIRPTKSAKGQRVYSRKDVENLLRVRDLLYRDGFTIAGAKKRLQRGPSPAADAADAADDHAHEPPTEREVEQNHDAHDADDEAEADERLAPEPASGPRAQVSPAPALGTHRVDPSVVGKLTALRTEVEAFLDELEAGA